MTNFPLVGCDLAFCFNVFYVASKLWLLIPPDVAYVQGINSRHTKLANERIHLNYILLLMATDSARLETVTSRSLSKPSEIS